MYKTLSCA